MKETPGKYLDMPDAIKRAKAVERKRVAERKRAIGWCMRLLWLDIDTMAYEDFYDFVDEYGYTVAYPEPIGFRSRYEDEEEADRRTFKEYQKKAIKLMDWFQENKNKPGQWLKFDMKMAFTVGVIKNQRCRITDNDVPDINYSYARQIALFLYEKRFDDAFKTCPECNHYFAVFAKHKKECCSHRCSMLHASKKKSNKDPELYRKINNIQAHFSVLKKKGWTEKEIRSSLKSYITKKKYASEEIPRYINQFIDQKG